MTYQLQSSGLISQSTMLNTNTLPEMFLNAMQKALHGDGLVCHVRKGSIEE